MMLSHIFSSNPKEPLSYRLLFWILLLSALFTLMITAVQLHTDYRHNRSDLDSSLEQISHSSLPAVGHALWALNKPQLDTILTGILDQPNMRFVEVIDYYGNAVSSIGNADVARPVSADYPIDVEQTGNTVRIGTLHVVATLDDIYKSLYDKALLILITQGLKTFFMSICILLLVDRLIIRHLKSVSEWARHVESGELDTPLSIRKSHSKTLDAFDHLVLSINRMREAIGLEFRKRERIERELAESEERYRVLYDFNPSMYFTVSAEGLIESVNLNGAQLLGYSREELVGTSIFDLSYEEDRQSTDEFFRENLKHPGNIHHREFRISCKDERVLWARESMQIIEGADGEQHILIVCEDVSEAHDLSEMLTYNASHDSLTGLVNRREFELRLERLINSTRKEKNHHALCFMDLDQFKIVNDTCGHVAGDELLRQIAHLFNHHVRARDTLARLGGDEFGIIMEHCSLEDAHRVALQLKDVVQEFQFSWEDHLFKLGVSIGLVAVTELTGSPADVMTQADSACYMAKDRGRNRVHVSQSDDAHIDSLRSQMQWVEQIHLALDNEWFQLYAQKIRHRTDQSRNQYELLLRMRDEQGEIITPDKFLPAAERYNIIGKVDRWVVSEAFRLLASHPAFMQSIEHISINVSGMTLSDSDYVAFVLDAINTPGLDAGKICFEITETAAIANLKEAMEFIDQTRQKGCHFSLDDFGSGLSSFAYLKNLPVDYLKIDGIFVQDIVDDEIDRAMVRAVQDIGRVMGMKTIAEFVENEAIIDILDDIGVDYLQGFAIGKPQPFIDLLTEADGQAA